MAWPQIRSQIILALRPNKSRAPNTGLHCHDTIIASHNSSVAIEKRQRWIAWPASSNDILVYYGFSVYETDKTGVSNSIGSALGWCWLPLLPGYTAYLCISCVHDIYILYFLNVCMKEVETEKRCSFRYLCVQYILFGII